MCGSARKQGTLACFFLLHVCVVCGSVHMCVFDSLQGCTTCAGFACRLGSIHPHCALLCGGTHTYTQPTPYYLPSNQDRLAGVAAAVGQQQATLLPQGTRQGHISAVHISIYLCCCCRLARPAVGACLRWRAWLCVRVCTSLWRLSRLTELLSDVSEWQHPSSLCCVQWMLPPCVLCCAV